MKSVFTNRWRENAGSDLLRGGQVDAYEWHLHDPDVVVFADAIKVEHVELQCATGDFRIWQLQFIEPLQFFVSKLLSSRIKVLNTLNTNVSL
jgi:hypothetical protein